KKAAAFKNLHALEVNPELINDDVIHSLRQLNKVHILHIAHTWQEGNGRPQKPADVNYVGLRGTAITDQALQGFDQFDNLLSLELAGIFTEGAGSNDENNQKNLNVLQMAGTTAAGVGLAALN